MNRNVEYPNQGGVQLGPNQQFSFPGSQLLTNTQVISNTPHGQPVGPSNMT